MPLQLFFVEDLRQHIASVTVAMLAASIATGRNVEYCRGVLDTARAQALAYGINWPQLVEDVQGVLSTSGLDIGRLLEG